MLVSSREVVRHALYRSGAYGMVTWLRTRRGGTATHLGRGDIRARFAAIYAEGTWRHGEEATPGSGSGSSLPATEGLRARLPDLLDRLGARTLLDVGCGDFTWMQHLSLSQRYIGIDIVPDVIAANAATYGGEGRSFLVGNAVEEALPEADVVLCREVLFHLSFADVIALLRNVVSTPRAYVIMTSDRQTRFNSDIPSGDFRLLNMQAGPFRLPPPCAIIDDSFVCADRILGVWCAADLTDLTLPSGRR